MRNITWDAPVYTSTVNMPNGMPIEGRRGVYTGTGADMVHLGEYSKDETLLPNATLIETIDASLDSIGINFERNISTLRNGSGMLAKYSLLGKEAKGPDGKLIRPVLSIENSYDGTAKLTAMLEALRLACLNGLIGFGTAFSLMERHSGLLNVDSVVRAIAPKVQAIEMPSFEAMAQITLNEMDGLHIVRNVVKKQYGSISGFLARQIEENWMHRSDDNRENNNLFGLYNAATFHLSRVAEERADKITYSRTNSERVSKVLTMLSISPDKLKEALVPITQEAAYKN